MTRHRTIFSTLLLAAFMAGPASAQAGSLLSGYGGPGGGAQAIVGSALVNGAGSGTGGSGGAGGGGGSSPSAGGGAASTGTPSGGQAGGAVLGQAGGAAGTRSGAQTGSGGARHASGIQQRRATHDGANVGTSGGASSTYPSSGSPRIVAGAAAADDMGVLSFTGSDLLLLALVLGVLAAIAALTRRLAGTQHYS